MKNGISILAALVCVMVDTVPSITLAAQWAGAHTVPAAAPLFAVAPVSDSRLMNIRGGFDLGNGLVASFGISRLVYINGNLVARTNVNLPDLSHVTGAEANALAAALGRVDIIQNGPGNNVMPGSINAAPGTLVIQNSLNNQQIQALTTINARVKDLTQFNAINLNNNLQSAINNSLGH